MTIIYLFFIFVSLYLSFILLILFARNYKYLFNDKNAKNLLSISVLIPAYNEEKGLEGTVRAVSKMNYPRKLLEVIIINDGSTDNTLKIAQKLAKEFNYIKVLSKENTGKADSLNQALKIAKNEIITIIDADSYPEKDSFLKMVNHFQNKDNAAVTSSIAVKDPNGLLERLQAIEYFVIAFARKLFDFVESVYITPGPLSMYRKEVLLEVGGFDTKNLTEDIEIAWKILKHKYRIRMCLSARVYTNVPLTFKKWWRQRLRWDIGGIQTMFKYKSTLFKKHYKMFGLFVTPKFLISHILSLTGFGVFTYIISKRLISFLLSTKYSYASKIPLFSTYSLNLNPSVFTFFIITLFIISLTYVIIGVKMVNKSHFSIKKSNFLFYLIFYLSLYPLILIHSLYRLVTNNLKW